MTKRLPSGWWIIPGLALGLLCWIAVAVTAIWLRSSAPANQSMADVRNGVLTVGTDHGGALAPRVAFVEALRQSGTTVRVTGRVCESACTLYLGVPGTCVSPRTLFGFHGPSSQIYGVGLSPAEFDRWSRIMADHYHQPIRAWFMAQARHVIVGMTHVRGSELIRLGAAKEC